MQAITKLPLIDVSDEDNLTWRLSLNGKYIVRSAHHHLMEAMIQNDALKVNGNLMLLWNLEIQPKVKHFLWRLLRQCLSTRQRLQNKGVSCSPFCAYCYSNYV
ncbi:hypothetical protein HKD37_09G025236 [Glycine soja]